MREDDFTHSSVISGKLNRIFLGPLCMDYGVFALGKIRADSDGIDTS